MKKILVLLTNHSTLGTSNEANGTYAPELTHALKVFMDASVAFECASINGGAVPLYGEETEDGINEHVIQAAEVKAQVANSKAISAIDPQQYDAVFYPGGFGLLSDLAEHNEAAQVTATLFEKGLPVGAVCHGPAGLLPVTLSDGTLLLDGRSVTGFSREEEIDFATIEKIPFLLEEALTRKAGQYSKVQPWGEHIVVDGNLITGQNPASATAVAQAMLKQMTD